MLILLSQRIKNKGNIVNFINKSIQKGANYISNKINKNKHKDEEDKKVEISKEFEVISTDMKFEPRVEFKQSEEEEFDDYNIYQNLTQKFSNELSLFKAKSNEEDEFEPKERIRKKRSTSESKIFNDEEDFEELTDKNYMLSEEEWKQLLKKNKK